jgi:hypothetical protein
LLGRGGAPAGAPPRGPPGGGPPPQASAPFEQSRKLAYNVPSALHLQSPQSGNSARVYPFHSSPKPTKTARISSQAGVVAPPESLNFETGEKGSKVPPPSIGAGFGSVEHIIQTLKTIAPPVGPLFGHPVAYLAKQLGLSRQRTSRLLNTGRIVGAERAEDGTWQVPCLPMIVPGRRGPRSSAWRFVATFSHAKGGRR